MSDAKVRAQLVETWKSRLLRFYDDEPGLRESKSASVDLLQTDKLSLGK